MKVRVNDKSETTSDLIPRVTNEKSEVNIEHLHLTYNKSRECCLTTQALNSILNGCNQNKHIGIGIVKKMVFVKEGELVKRRLCSYYIVLEIDEDKKVKSIKYGRADEVDYNYAHIISYANELFKGATLNHIEEVNAIYMKGKDDRSRGEVFREYPNAKKFAFGYALGDAIKECKRKNSQSKDATSNTMSFTDVMLKLESGLIVFD